MVHGRSLKNLALAQLFPEPAHWFRLANHPRDRFKWLCPVSVDGTPATVGETAGHSII